MSLRSRNAGFTLVEVIVAFAILAVAAGVVYEALSSGLTRHRRSIEQHTAVLIAQSVLDRAGADLDLKQGLHQGQESGGYRWRLRIKPASLAEGEKPYTLTAFDVTASVTWVRGELSIRKLILGPAP